MTPTVTPYWLVIHVRLHEALRPAKDDPDRRLVNGYYTTFGVTAASELEAEELVASAVRDGEIDWDKSETSLVTPERLDRDIVARSADWTAMGIWYRAGRALYSDEPYDDELDESGSP
jgi:hypothetical protein